MNCLHRTVALYALSAALVGCGESGTVPPTGPDASIQTDLTFTGTWKTMPSLEPARWRAAGAILGKSIVVVGGRAPDPLSRVDAFSVETHTWSALARLPITLYDANGATVIKGKLYVTGGRAANYPNDQPRKFLYVYDPATNRWTRKADMPFRGSAGIQAELHGQLYVYTFPQSPTGPPSFFAAYNPMTNTWVSRPPPPGAHFAYPVAGAIDGKLYLTGGTAAQGGPDSVVDVYDPATRTWARKSPMPTARSTATAAVVRGKLFVAGGAVTSPENLSVSTNVVEAYDPVTDTWATGPSMPTPRGHATSAWAGGRFYVIDGISDGGRTSRVEALSTSY